MDSVRTARRLGADESVCVYRRSRTELPARIEEVHHAEQEGVRFEFLTAPMEVLGDEKGWVSGLKCIRMELGEPDASGRRRRSRSPDPSSSSRARWSSWRSARGRTRCSPPRRPTCASTSGATSRSTTTSRPPCGRLRRRRHRPRRGHGHPGYGRRQEGRSEHRRLPARRASGSRRGGGRHGGGRGRGRSLEGRAGSGPGAARRRPGAAARGRRPERARRRRRGAGTAAGTGRTAFLPIFAGGVAKQQLSLLTGRRGTGQVASTLTRDPRTTARGIASRLGRRQGRFASPGVKLGNARPNRPLFVAATAGQRRLTAGRRGASRRQRPDPGSRLLTGRRPGASTTTAAAATARSTRRPRRARSPPPS